MQTQRWQDWRTALVGAWILFTPWIVGTWSPAGVGDIASWSHLVLGTMILVLGLAAVFAYRTWEEWVEVVLGLAVIAMPWVLGFSGSAAYTISDVISGLVIVGLSGWMAIARPEGAA